MWIRGLSILVLTTIVLVIRKKSHRKKEDNWEEYYEKDEQGLYPWETEESTSKKEEQ